jgi:hypothetical protein
MNSGKAMATSEPFRLAPNRRRASGLIQLILALIVNLGMSAAMTVSAMGGTPERSSDGAPILNNHGTVSAAGETGWYLAATFHWISLTCLISAFPFVLALLCLGDRDRRLSLSRASTRLFLGGVIATAAWAVVLSTTPLAPHLRALP